MGSKGKRLVFKIKRDVGRRKLLARSSTTRHRSPLFISLGIHLMLGLAGFTYWFVAENRGRMERGPLNLLVALGLPYEKAPLPEAPAARPIPRSIFPATLKRYEPEPQVEAALPPSALARPLDGPEDRRPRLLHRPELAGPGCCAAHGACAVDLELDARGLVRSARLSASSGCERFDAAALSAARASAYAPALRGGRPREARLRAVELRAD